jgi:hypothetical protein
MIYPENQYGVMGARLTNELDIFASICQRRDHAIYIPQNKQVNLYEITGSESMSTPIHGSLTADDRQIRKEQSGLEQLPCLKSPTNNADDDGPRNNSTHTNLKNP